MTSSGKNGLKISTNASQMAFIRGNKCMERKYFLKRQRSKQVVYMGAFKLYGKNTMVCGFIDVIGSDGMGTLRYVGLPCDNTDQTHEFL